jgi:hypothetical protein
MRKLIEKIFQIYFKKKRRLLVGIDRNNYIYHETGVF